MATKTVKIESVLDSKFKLETLTHGHTVIVDQPANAGGTDAGPTPLDYLFTALSGCIGTVARIIAMQKQIALRGMKITVEGDINVDGLLGKPTDDPVGFQGIRITADIDADMTAEEKEAFVHEVDARCPVSFNLANNTPVTISAI
ncbi:MAG: OsmC family protein [Kiritimatiellales bacterium]